MREEFHGRINSEGITVALKQLYGWNTLNSNVWLPSLIELVGIDPNIYDDTRGCYYSAMQGISTSSKYHVDAQGGTQFAYFQQYNAQGGGEKLWAACNQQISWLRSSYAAVSQYSWIISGLNRFNAYEAYPLTDSYAVSSMQVPYLSLIPKGRGKAQSLHCFSSPQKGTFGSPAPL